MEEYGNFFSRWFYFFFCPTVCRGLRRPLDAHDVFSVHSADAAEACIIFEMCSSF